MKNSELKKIRKALAEENMSANGIKDVGRNYTLTEFASLIPSQMGVCSFFVNGVPYSCDGANFTKTQSEPNVNKTKGILSTYTSALIANSSSLSNASLVALKADIANLYSSSVWPKLKELWVPPVDGGLACGAVKIKTATGVSAVMTNTSFVDGDFTAYSGLKGNGSTKKLATGFNPDSIKSEWGWGVFVTSLTDAGGVLAGDGTNNYIAYSGSNNSKINNATVAQLHATRLLSLQNSATTGLATSHVGGYTIDSQPAGTGVGNPLFLFAHNASFFTDASLGGYAAWAGTLSSAELLILQTFFDNVSVNIGRFSATPSINFCGDSNTAGFGVTSAQRFSALVSATLGMPERNNGVNGSAISSTATNNSPGSSFVTDKWYSVNKYRKTAYPDSILVAMFGTNDDQYKSDLTTLATEYDDWVSIQIKIGYKPENILLITPLNIKLSDAIYSSRTRLLSIGQTVQTIASKYGTKYLDSYPLVNDSLMSGDGTGLHLNVAGHAALASAILAVI